MTNHDKSKKLKALEYGLKIMANGVLKKYNPKVVAITGSVGKTSAKEAVGAILATQFRIRKSEKNYNNEIGLPLTIIGAESGGKSLAGWGMVFLKWLGMMMRSVEYPEILILEMGADRPGDISYFTSFIKPEAGILTDISFSHIEYFKTLDNIAREKSVLLKNLSDQGVAILNVDNAHIAKLRTQLKSKMLTFGFSPEADIRATDVFFFLVS